MKQKCLHIALLAVLMMFSQCFFNSCGTKSRLSTADKKFEAGEYAGAADMYAKVYSKIPFRNKELKGRVAFNQGQSLDKLNYSRSEMMYNRSFRSDYQDSTVYLKLAQALHRNGKYGDASKYYNFFLQYDSTSLIAKSGIQGTKLAAHFKDHPTRYIVKRDNFFFARNKYVYSPNFPGSEYDQLYFTSNNFKPKKGKLINFVTNQPNGNIVYVKKDASGKWSRPEPAFAEEFTNGLEIGTPNFSPDGRTMYFSVAPQKEESDANVEIYFSSRAGGEWTTPQQITFFKDSTITVAHPAIAPDGQTIYFVSDAPNGEGGKDIWKGTLVETECKYIENLGKDINTPGDEMFPYIRTDGTLYFASDGHPGIGGLDIFKAEPTEDGWEVSNMGTPINSNFDDFGIAFEGQKEKGYFSSNRGQIRGFDAIYTFELPELQILVEGKVLDDKMSPIPDANVRLVSNTGENIRVVTKKDGTYRIKIDKDMDCVMLGIARGFLNKKAEISTMGLNESKTFTVDLVLPAVFRPVQLTRIFFEFDKWNLTPDSEEGLRELYQVLKDNPNVVIEISAHTDYFGNDGYNISLSKRRAGSVVDYLIKSGINKERLVAVGYGKNNPYVVDEQLHAKHQFLPIDTVLTEEFILSLEPQQQEIANQINRRTEFKVLRMSLR